MVSLFLLTLIASSVLPFGEFGKTVHQKWCFFLWRNRWLLTSLLVILSYGLPGEGIGKMDWTPSIQGVFEALIQCLRLITMLGILAILMSHFDHRSLLLGLYTLFKPLNAIGFPSQRSVVRLTLVLQQLNQSRGKESDWHVELLSIFAPPAEVCATEQSIEISTQAWQAKDGVIVASGLLLFVLSVFLAD